MSQSLFANSSVTVESAVDSSSQPSELDEFSYKPMPTLVPVACFLSVASVLGIFSWVCITIPFVGLILGFVALFRIRASNGEFRGTPGAIFAIVMSLTFMATGVNAHVQAYKNELPPGHFRVNFPRDISAKEFVITDGRRELHPDVLPLVGKRVFLKGWMYQALQNEHIDSFVLLKDSGECCFGGNPKPFDMMEVRMVDGLTTRGFTTMISVAGVLRANPAVPEGAPVYTLEATQCGLAQSSF